MHLTPSIYFLVVVLQLAGQRTFSADSSQYSNYFFFGQYNVASLQGSALAWNIKSQFREMISIFIFVLGYIIDQ